VWNKDPTAREVAKAIAGNFVDLGVPVRFRSDGGSQFTGSEFTQFLRRWGVTGVLSTPHYPQSNGHAEAAVKAMKSLVIKTVDG
jgi:transposase InsO family protein